jgi:hypothetical protein
VKLVLLVEIGPLPLPPPDSIKKSETLFGSIVIETELNPMELPVCFGY